MLLRNKSLLFRCQFRHPSLVSLVYVTYQKPCKSVFIARIGIVEFLLPRPADHCHLAELIVLCEGEAVENVDMGQFLIELNTF